ncbi:MAG: LysR family transcriptional regulator [Actinobacteria bacterium]|nr:MAG: LysR family transcriptional regulator [Actinomycetota bacterium]
MLNVHRMSLLREVASRGSIAAAAEALYITPSAVSQQLAVLEREAGVELLERVGRGVRLTHAGKRLVTHTERVLAVLEEAEADLEAVSEGVAGQLRTCAFPTAARALLVPALARIGAENPSLELSMVDLEPEESLPMLKTGDLDIVLTYGFDRLPERPDPGIERHLLLTEPLYIAVLADDPRAQGEVGVSDFRDDNWVVGRDGSPFLDVMVRVAGEAGFEARVDLHSNDYQVILASVQAGLGVALVPPLAFFAEYPGVVCLSPTDVQINRRVLAVIRRGSGGRPAVEMALRILREEAHEAVARYETLVPLAE